MIVFVFYFVLFYDAKGEKIYDILGLLFVNAKGFVLCWKHLL